MTRTIRAVAVAAAVLLPLTRAANAQYERRKSTLAIADRVEIPGAILEPGNYVVRVADVQANRNVVVFESMDGTTTFATVLTTPHELAHRQSDAEFLFYPMPAGQPRVLRTWFAPEDKYGQDFVYPPERAAELRNITKEEIPVATAEMSPPAPQPAAPPAPVASAPEPPAPAPIPADTTIASNAPPSGTDSDSLPQTASPYPFVAALGFAALASAFVASRRRRPA
jgi:LPXTG-motif cell wall-anchored protein